MNQSFPERTADHRILAIAEYVCTTNKDKTDWFFCEVKGEGDRLKQEQANYFESIELLSGKEIFVIKIDKKPAKRHK